MKTLRCSLCDNVDFQYRYVLIEFVNGDKGRLCANCIDEWLGVNKSNEKRKFMELKQK